ncbi:hypothetical protein RDI58_010631 [Solanum bulbocastanum]|uniref:Uncharacterized protein n=1 Tax=Solanum bulbocastanum TaxID=147425 RepID=A0AAN8TQW0_SOLBU
MRFSSSSSSFCANARRYQFFVDVAELFARKRLNFRIARILGKQLMMHLGQCLKKEQPGELRCYGRSVTTSSLKKDEEINNLKQKHANEITSLKEELREEMRHLFTQLLQNNPGLNFQDILGCVGSNLASPVNASSAQAVNLPHYSGSSYDSVLQKESVLPILWYPLSQPHFVVFFLLLLFFLLGLPFDLLLEGV